MAEPQVIVSRTIRVDGVVGRDLPRSAREDGLEVGLDDGRTVRLPPDEDKTPAYAQILATLQRLRMPVYLEVDAETNSVLLLRIPDVGRVRNLRETGTGLEFELDSSHALFSLPKSAKLHGRLAETLREAERGRRALVVTSNDAHEVIDARFLDWGPDDGPLPDFPIPPGRRRPPWDIFGGWRWWPIWPWRWWSRGCVSDWRALQVFNAMAAKSCAPLTIPAPCIPFLYPDDGCWARAHEMARLIKDMSVSPRKVWIQGSLHTPTRNHPSCSVRWNWHVAPTLCVRSRWWIWWIFPWGTRRMVIDPSLFTSPVSVSEWKSVQGDAGATLTYTDASDYLWGQTDADYSKTADRLDFYRARLLERSVNTGPPPYSNCP